jgi:hypothetical protein
MLLLVGRTGASERLTPVEDQVKKEKEGQVRLSSCVSPRVRRCERTGISETDEALDGGDEAPPGVRVACVLR